MKTMLPGFIHVFEWSFCCCYYCKYRNCNPVIKWNMTDFLHKKTASFFLQCPFRGCWYPFIYTSSCRVQFCLIENLFLHLHGKNKEFIALFPQKIWMYSCSMIQKIWRSYLRKKKHFNFIQRSKMSNNMPSGVVSDISMAEKIIFWWLVNQVFMH